MKKKLALGVTLLLMAHGTASLAGPGKEEVASAVLARAAPAACARPDLLRQLAGGDPLSTLRDAHKDPQRCKLSICIPASINLDAVCELTTARDSEGRYNCRMVINDFLRNCTASCHTGDWRWLDNYRGPY